MNKTIRWGFALALLPLVSCADTPAPVAASPAPVALSSADASFVTEATQANLAEIAEAQLAEKSSGSPAVQKFAAQMITDHTAANTKLASIATAKGVTPPTTPSDDQTKQLDALTATHGHRFNHDYIADQIADHSTVLTLFQNEAASGTDADLKAFAADTVPVISEHLKMADALAAAGGHHHLRRHR